MGHIAQNCPEYRCNYCNRTAPGHLRKYCARNPDQGTPGWMLRAEGMGTTTAVAAPNLPNTTVQSAVQPNTTPGATTLPTNRPGTGGPGLGPQRPPTPPTAIFNNGPIINPSRRRRRPPRVPTPDRIPAAHHRLRQLYYGPPRTVTPATVPAPPPAYSAAAGSISRTPGVPRIRSPSRKGARGRLGFLHIVDDTSDIGIDFDDFIDDDADYNINGEGHY